MTHWIYILVLVITGLVGCSSGQEMKAEFQMRGVNGEATFTWSGGILTAELLVHANLGVTSVEIHPIWVDYGSEENKCTVNVLGDTIEGLSAQATISSGYSVSVTFSNFTSQKSVEGHSIVLLSTVGNQIICATIQQDIDHVTALVRLRGSVFGHVHLRQANDDSGSSSTRIVTDLATLSDAQNGNWRISNSFQTCEDFMENVLNNIYDPTSAATGSCSSSDQNACAIGDLSSKHGQLNFASQVGAGRRAFTDSNLPLYGDNNVQGLLMIIIPIDENVKPACGKINVYRARSAKATFSNNGITGTILFSQESPFDPTKTNVDLTGLAGNAGGYHIHQQPVPERESSSQSSMCVPERLGGHFNPYIDQVGTPDSLTYPAPLSSTYDMYEVGDLSAKYGMLNDLYDLRISYTDYNLQLFGHNSIVGRSLVIHRNDATSSRWVCVNIVPQYPVIAAEALFLYPLVGRVQFMQEQDHPESETSVFVSLDYINERPDTSDHLWMVGNMHLGADMLDRNPSARCLSAGSVYNPRNLWPDLSDREYALVCDNNRPEACKTGDVAGKLGRLGIGNSGATQDQARKWFATDIDLPLSGPHSIIGKPVVIRTVENTASLACAEIKPVHPIQLVARFNSSALTGTVRFRQVVGFGSKQTLVETLGGLTGGNSLMVYELPLREGQDSCDNIGQVFDPLEIGNAQPTTPKTDDKYKVGDLSRLGAESTTYNLPLSGVNSIKGRSVAVVGNTGTIACATIDWDMAGWTSIHANATYKGEVIGTISLHQIVHPDGAMSDTSILTDLRYAKDSKKFSKNHNWHTHEKLVTGDSQAATKRCISTGPHYNPFHAAIGEVAYATKCSRTNQLRCELGDQSMKTMPIDIGLGRKLHTDTYEPLFGNFTVLDRSIVVHAEERGAPRFTCADIVPHTASPLTITVDTPRRFSQLSHADKTKEINNVYSDAIRAYPGEVIVVIQSSNAEKTSVLVHFVGPRSAALRSRFSQTLLSDESKLGSFNPAINIADMAVSSVLPFLCVLVPSTCIIYLLQFES